MQTYQVTIQKAPCNETATNRFTPRNETATNRFTPRNEPVTNRDAPPPHSLINQRIEQLYPRLQHTARRVFCNQPVPVVEEEDILQNLAVRILERGIQIPSRLDQTDAYLMSDAVNAAGIRCCVAEITYTRYVQPEVTLAPQFEQESEDPGAALEYFVSGEQTPEDTIIFSELIDALQKRIQELTPQCRQVISLALAGFTDAEIARQLGVTKSAISQRRNTISRVLQPVMP